MLLKEQRKLILMPRKTSFSLIHLGNMTNVTKQGGIVCLQYHHFTTNPKRRNNLQRP